MKKFILLMAIIVGIGGAYFYNYMEDRQKEPEKFYSVIVDMDNTSMTVCVIRNSRTLKINGKKHDITLFNAADYSYNYDDYYYIQTDKFTNYTWKDATCSRNEFGIGSIIMVTVDGETYKEIGTSQTEEGAKKNAIIPQNKVVSIELLDD